MATWMFVLWHTPENKKRMQAEHGNLTLRLEQVFVHLILQSLGRVSRGVLEGSILDTQLARQN